MIFFFKNVLLNEKSFLYISISNIKGIGYNRAFYLNTLVGLQKNLKVNELNNYYFYIYSNLISLNYNTDNFLLKLREKKLNNLLLISYKGLKYKMGLPIRGQRTKTNAKTSKNLKKKINIKK